jgi:hypothetical protein
MIKNLKSYWETYLALEKMSRSRKFLLDHAATLIITPSSENKDFFFEELINDEEDFTEFIQLNFSIPQLLEDNIEIKIKLGYEDWKVFSTFDIHVLNKYGLSRI